VKNGERAFIFGDEVGNFRVADNLADIPLVGIVEGTLRRERLRETSPGARPRAFGGGMAEVQRASFAAEVSTGKTLLRDCLLTGGPKTESPLGPKMVRRGLAFFSR